MSIFGGGSFLGGLGGMLGGALGSMFGPLGAQMGRMIGSAIGDMLGQLISQFGHQNVQNALTNNYTNGFLNGLDQAVSQSGLPGFAKDEISQGINQAREMITPLPTPHACQAGVNEALGDTTEAQGLDFGKEIMKECFEENTKKGKGNWLVVLAQALGSKSGEHLKEMVKLGNQMGEMDSKKNPEEYAKVQAMFQAESKIFGMFQEAISTMLKSIGEGLSAVARKQ